MIRYLSFNRNLFYAFLFSLTMLFAGLDSANAQCPAATYTGSGGPYCVSGSPGFTLQSNASNPNIQKWQYSIDFGASWVDIPSSNTATYTPSAFPSGSYQIIYYQAIIVNCLGFGATPHNSSSPAGPITVVPLPVAGTFSFTSGTNATSSTICNGGTATYGLTGSDNLLDIAAGDIVTTTYTITNSNPSVGGTSSFTRTSLTTGDLVINPTNVTSSIQTTTYTVTATNGTCTPIDIGSVTVCVYPSISGGVLDVSVATVCTGTSTTLSFTTLPTNIVATAGCTGTTYAITSDAASLSGSCGIVTDGIGGAFTTGNAPGSVTLTPTNTTNTVQTITYTVTATNGPCADEVYSVTVDVVPNIVNTGITVSTPTPTICSGQTATVNITNLDCATGYINGLTTIVVTGPTFGGAGAADMSGGVASSITYAANSASFTVDPAISQCLSGTALYTITAQNNPCSAPVSIGSVTVTVMPAIIAGATVTGTSTICTGASVNTTTTGACADGYGTLTSYTLSVASSGANITSTGLPGTLTNTTGNFTVNPENITCDNSANTITYNITATNDATCSSFLAGSFTVTVTPNPVVNGQVFSITAPVTIVCDGASTTITPNNVCAGATYVWERQVNGGGYVFFGSFAGPLSTAAMTTGACAVSTYDFRLTINIGTCTEVANLPTITVYPTINASIAAGSATVCSGGVPDFSTSTISCEQTGATYELLENGTPVVTNTTSRASFLAAIGTYATPVNYTCGNVVYNYSIRVTNNAAAAGCSVTSSTTPITVNPAPSSGSALSMSVTSSISVCTGTPATITTNRCAGATATWRVSIDGAAYQTIASAGITITDNFDATYTTSGLTTSACLTTTYTFEGTFTLGTCSAVATTSNTVSVFPAPIASTLSITSSTGTLSSSTNADICTAVNSTVLSSTVPACGSIVRWEYSLNNGTSWSSIASSAANSITVTNVPQNTIYRAVISNGALCATTFSTNTVSITVNVIAGGTPATTTPTICNGSSANISLGSYLGNILDWESDASSSFGAPTSLGLTSNPITVSPTSTLWYRAVIGSGVCTTYSTPIEIKVYDVPTNTIAAVASPICSSTASQLNLSSASTTTGVTVYSITSDYPSANSSVYNSTTEPTSPYTVPAAYVNPNGTTNYTYTVTTAPCAAASASASITVDPAPTVTLTSSVATICDGGSTTISGTSTPVIGGTTLYEITAAPGGTIYASSTTAPTFPFSVNPTATTIYTYSVTNGSCAPVTATTTVTVIPVPTATVTSPSPICGSSSTILTLTNGSTTTGVTTYQITSDYPSANSDVYSTSTTAPTSPYTVPSNFVNPNGVTTYTYTVISSPCATVTATVSVTVNPVPTVTLAAASATICNGGTTTITGTSTPIVAGTTTYEITAAPGGTLYASSTTAPTFPFTVTPSATTTYTYTVSNGACAPVSATTTVTVIEVPTASVTSTTPICATTSTVLTLSTTNTTTGITTYQITSDYPSANSDVYSTSTTAPTSPFTVPAAYVNPNGVTNYTFTVISAPCGSATSTFAVTVQPASVGGTVSASATQCSPASGSLTLSGHTGSVVNWEFSTNGGASWTTIANTTTTNAYAAITTTTMYRAVVQNGVCATANSSAVTITVIPVPTATISSPTPICATSSTVLTLGSTNTTSGVTTYQITSDYPSSGSVVYATNTTAPNTPFTVSSTYVNPNGVTNYTYTVTSAPCGAVTATTAVTVHPVPTVTLTGANASICVGSSTTISGTATPVVAGTTTYMIGTTSGGSDIYASSTTAPTFPLTVTPATTTTYYYSVSNGACSPVIASVTVVVIPQPTATISSPTPICATSSTVLTLSSGSTVSGLTTYTITSDYPTAGSVVYATNTAAPNSPFTVNGTYINPNGVTTYTYTLTSSPCASTTVSTSVTVHPVPTVTLGAAASTICNGSSTTISGTATPVVAGVTTYQITAAPGGTLYAASTTAPTFPFAVTPTATTTYTYTITNGSCSPVSATTTVTVIPVPTASVTSPSPICASSSTILTLASSNTTAGVTTYKITSDYPSAGSVVYATNTTAPNSPFTVTSTFVNPNGVTNYTYEITSAPCGSVTSTVAVTVYPVPSASITLSPSPICLGSTTTLSVNIGNAVASVTSYRIGTSAGASDILGATTIGTNGTFTTTVTVTPPVGVTTYFLTVTTSPCSSVSSNTSVTVNPTTVGGSLSAGTIVCPGSNNTTTFTLSGQTGAVVKWQQSTNDGASWTDITNTLTTYTATNVSVSTLYRAVVQSGVCPPQNSATSGVFVNTNPVANFSNTTVCFNTPPTVFTNSTSAGTTLSVAQQALYNIVGTVTTTTTYAWNFGDPTSGSNTSTATNPTHAYTTDGTFNATLVATTNTLVGATTVSSCSNSITKQVTVNPVTTADYTTSPVCLGGASPVNISNFNSANTYSIVWGDATAAQTTTTSTTTRTYTNPGQYSVRLKVTNIYGCSDSITKNVTAWALPTTTGVNISNTAPCVGSTITFTPVGDAGGTTFVINPLTGVATATVANAASITNYLWDFGDGNTATTRIASNTYAVAGTYTIKLTITNSNGCSQTFTFTATPVVVQPTPVASFSNTTECYGVATTFNSNGSTVASGSITGWSWNFGDPSSAGNNTSTTANPTHLFTAPGTYTVALTVTTAAGCTNTTTKQVTVNPLPLVGFNPSATIACAGSTITFVSTSTITSGSFTYGWRVSDNAGNFSFASSMISANASLVQTFATAGTYNVRLYATSANGCIDSATKTITINANPTATIVVNPGTNQICIYETFTFTSTGSVAGSGTISSYAWTFGDGSTSTAANPAAKSYANPGNYTVTLTITNSNGCTNTTSKVVTVNPKPVVNFNATTVCFGYTMNFTDASTTSASSTYLWNFGDPASGASNTAITQNSTHNYTTAGTFSVKLVVTNASGCKDSLTKLVTVWPRPVANFKADTVCEGNATTFTNLSTIASGSMSYVWYFGDAANSTSTSTNPTFLYTPGVYSVKLVVTSGFGCIDSVRKSILVKANPKPTFIVANACLRDAITLDTTGSNGSASVVISINYGDGSAATTSLTHTYAMSGIYTVTLTMTDNGCTSTISKVVTIYDLPLPSFSVSAYTICVNAVDTFSNTSTIASGTIVSNKWEVINASNTVVASTTYTSNQEFIYAFNTAGVYRVKLTATSDKGCVDTISKTVTVNALPTVAINSINFKTQAFHACLGTPHEFTSTGSTAGSGTIASYFWDFGDGSSSTSQNPVYTYKAVGSYDVTLTITNSNGCTFSKTQTVVVDPIPDATIKPFNFPVETCNGTPFTFTGPNGTGYSYVWTRSGAVIGTSQSVTVNPPTSGWYYLAVTSSFGCTKVDSIFLTVNPLPVITLSDKNVTISKGWNKQVTAVVTGPNPTFTYLWTAKDTSSRASISNNSIPNPILTPPNNVLSYYFVVTVTDQKGCVQRDTVFFTMLEDYNLKPTNLITPNGDNMNDYFFIENIETYDDVEVTIFNRWGNVVYQTKNYAAAPWNGTYQNTGGDLPDGTYYYIIRTGHNMADGKELIYKGNVTILRGR